MMKSKKQDITKEIKNMREDLEELISEQNE